MRKIITFFLILSCLPFFANAQNINIPNALENEISVAINPNYPKPNQKFTVSLSLYTADLSSAYIIWSKDGKAVAKGFGLTSYPFQAGSDSKLINIEANITLTNGTSFTKKIGISPAGVDLIWEADSYVPPFYQGKTLYPPQGRLKVVAIPNFSFGSSKLKDGDLIFNWSNDSVDFQDQSGLGKNTLLLNGSVTGQNENINVVVTDPTTNTTADAHVTIPTHEPELLFYKIDPYYGIILDRTLTNPYPLTEPELQVLGAPYFLTRDSGNRVTYNWTLNGNSIPNLTYSRTAVFRKPEDSKGESLLSLTIDNSLRILQEAENKLVIQFDKGN